MKDNGIKTRWPLGSGYPLDEAEDTVKLFMDAERSGMTVKIGDHLPKRARAGKQRYRLVLEATEPIR